MIAVIISNFFKHKIKFSSNIFFKYCLFSFFIFFIALPINSYAGTSPSPQGTTQSSADLTPDQIQEQQIEKEMKGNTSKTYKKLTQDLTKSFSKSDAAGIADLQGLINSVETLTVNFQKTGYQLATDLTATAKDLLFVLILLLLIWGSIISVASGDDGIGDFFKKIISLFMFASVILLCLYNYAEFSKLIISSFQYIADVFSAKVGANGGNPNAKFISYIFSVDINSASTFLKDMGMMWHKADGLKSGLMAFLDSIFLFYILVILALAFMVTLVTYFTSQVFVIIALMLGPIFIPLVIWKESSFLFQGWLKYTIIAGLYKVVIILIYVLIVSIIGYIQHYMANVTNGSFINLSDASNALNILWLLLGLLSMVGSVISTLVTGKPTGNFDPMTISFEGGMIDPLTTKKQIQDMLTKQKKSEEEVVKVPPAASPPPALKPPAPNYSSTFKTGGNSGTYSPNSQSFYNIKTGNHASQNFNQNSSTSSFYKKVDLINRTIDYSHRMEKYSGEFSVSLSENGVINEGTLSSIKSATTEAAQKSGGVAASAASGAAEVGAEEAAGLVAVQVIPVVDVIADGLVAADLAYDAYEIYESENSGENNHESYYEQYVDYMDNLTKE